MIAKMLFATAAATGLLLVTPAAAGAAPGRAIHEACGATFGQLVSAGQSSGDAAHTNYAGGARAFSDPAVLAAHGCNG